MKSFKHKIMTSSLILLTMLVSACKSGGTSDKITVKIGLWPEPQQTQELNMFKVWKERFEADYPKYRIVGESYTYSPDTIHAKALAKQLPTVFSTWFTEPPMLINNGYIKDITDILTEYDWLDKMDVQMKETLTKNGRVYGIPRDGYGLGLFLNLETLAYYGILSDNDEDGKIDLYDDEGKPLYPTTFEDIYTISQTINEWSEGSDKGLLILSANKNGGWQFSNMAWNFGAELEVYNETTGKWAGNLADARAVEALEWIQMMAQESLTLTGTTFSYNDWYTRVNDQVAMAIVGSDVISLAVTNGGMKKENIAFVPMPAGPHGDQYSLFGGTPFVFSANATDDEVKGAVRFLEYMGRSPENSSASVDAMQEGADVAVKKGIPILPTIKPWINEEYLTAINGIEDNSVNVDMDYFKDFYEGDSGVYNIRHLEVPYFAQEMYTLLDGVLQAVLTNPYQANPLSLLTTANATFNNNHMSKL